MKQVFFQASVSAVHEIISGELAALPSFLFVEEDFAKTPCRAFPKQKNGTAQHQLDLGEWSMNMSNGLFFSGGYKSL